MTKAIIGILIAIAVAAVYGFTLGVESWSDNQAWWLLGIIAVVLLCYSGMVYINRNESVPKK